MYSETRIIPREFYERDPRRVARELLGAIIERALPTGQEKRCVIVEVEAYLGPEDPASRASKHRRGRIVERLWGPVGVTLVYGIHTHWMLNIIAHEPRGWGAVLLRACRPLDWEPSQGRCPGAGPGRLTRYLLVDRGLDGIPVYELESPLRITRSPPYLGCVEAVGESHRIGVRSDLSEPMRYCVLGDPCVSVRC